MVCQVPGKLVGLAMEHRDGGEPNSRGTLIRMEEGPLRVDQLPFRRLHRVLPFVHSLPGFGTASEDGTGDQEF